MNELYLQHHGVKGMRWGVRRYQNKDGSLTPAGRKRYSDGDSDNDTKEKTKLTTEQKIAIGAAVAAGTLAVLGGMYVYKKNNIPLHTKHYRFGYNVDLNDLSTDDIFLSKGQKMQRISSKSIEDYAEEGRRIYVSYLKKDNRIYKEEMPKFIRDWGKQGIISDDGRKAYAHVLKTKTDIKAPSKKTMAELYMKATNSTEVDEGKYLRFMTNLNDQKNPEVKKFFDLVKERGYNAVLDENDAGNFTKSPLILLNPKDDVEFSNSHQIRTLEKIINVVLM